ncbi:MAG TPA: threonine/serine exporter family protein [Nocardioides sp.]|uniref:threonine/serine ThrE exporter family protein n=1 Tax=Nocardioides sp. TaxID=35761 RepID=UPI002E339C7B|nr:threonine/serine exporter family protein [Nocardioides sp.]HEX3929964.1 threonine/serine exporter family protein [Nocardioides sp.]
MSPSSPTSAEPAEPGQPVTVEPRDPAPEREPTRDRETTREITATLSLALRIGELLLSSGAGAGDVSAAMRNVAWACGLRGYTADVMFTQLTMSHQTSTDEPALIQIRQVRYREVDYGDLTEVDHLIRDLVTGEIDRAEATSRLNRIISTGHARRRWLVTVALGVMGGGVGMVLGGDWVVVGVAAVAAMLVDLLQRQMSRRRLPTFYQQVAGGLLATLIAVGIDATPANVSSNLVISTSIIMLLAGVNFLGAIQDALTGFPVTAGARILEAFLATAGVVAGVSGGLKLADVFGVDLGRLNPGAYSIADWPAMMAGGAIAAAAYAFAAYAPRRCLLPIAAVAAVAIGIYVASYDRGLGVAWSSAVAALFIGLVSYPVAARARIPTLVVIAAGITPFLPGLSIYRGLTLLATNSSKALLAMVTAAAIAIALSSGAILGEYVAQPIRREARRLESRLAGPRLVGPHTVPGVRALRRRRARKRAPRPPGATSG